MTNTSIGEFDKEYVVGIQHSDLKTNGVGREIPEYLGIPNKEIMYPFTIMNKTYFENETYNRIKYEISKFLRLNNRRSKLYKDKIQNIINNDFIKEKDKRKELKIYVEEMILSFSYIDDSKNIEEEYNHKLERFRTPCNKNINRYLCNQNQHCIWEQKLMPEGENISKNKTKKFKKLYPHMYEKYSKTLLNEDIITQGIFIAEKNVFGNKLTNHKNKMEIQEILNNEIDTILNNYTQDTYEEILRSSHQNEGGKCKLYINKINLIDNKDNLDKYSSLIVEDLIRNKMKRKEILEGLIDNIVNEIDNKENENSIIFNDDDLNNGKLKKFYEKNIDKYIKNRDVKDYEDIENEEKNTNPLPVKYQKKLKYNFKIIINENTPINLLQCFTILVNQIPNIKRLLLTKKLPIPEGDFTYKIIRNLFLKYIEIIGNIKETSIPYWKYLLDNYENEKKDNVDLIQNYKDYESYIKNDNHWYTDKDLEVLHNLFNINIITITRKHGKDEGFKVYYNKQYNYYVILHVNKNINTQKKKYEVISLYEQSIFFIEEFSDEFREMIDNQISEKPRKIKIKKNKVKLVENAKPYVLKIKKKRK